MKLFYPLFLSLMLFSACSTPQPDQPLKNTYWSLEELYAQDREYFDHQPDLHLVFHINDHSLHGSDGCNQIKANYKQTAQNFHFLAITSTQIACPQGEVQSQRFIQALEETDQIDVDENVLMLYHNGLEIARFEAKEAY